MTDLYRADCDWLIQSRLRLTYTEQTVTDLYRADSDWLIQSRQRLTYTEQTVTDFYTEQTATDLYRADCNRSTYIKRVDYNRYSQSGQSPAMHASVLANSTDEIAYTGENCEITQWQSFRSRCHKCMYTYVALESGRTLPCGQGILHNWPQCCRWAPVCTDDTMGPWMWQSTQKDKLVSSILFLHHALWVSCTEHQSTSPILTIWCHCSAHRGCPPRPLIMSIKHLLKTQPDRTASPTDQWSSNWIEWTGIGRNKSSEIVYSFARSS